MAAAVLGAFLAVPAVAQAAEVHFTGDDIRVTVDSAGQARVEHALAYRVSGGPLKGLDLAGIEPEAVLDPVAPVAADGELRNAAHVERKGDRALHVTMDPGQKFEKGHTTLVVRVGYGVDLVAAHELVSDGAMWRIAWTAPLAAEGYDGARVVLDLPGAPTEPRAAAADGTVSDDGRVVTLRRGAERDELEMTRPHVARGEAASWMARVDPAAFPGVRDPSLRPAPEAPPPPPENAWKGWAVAAVCGLLFAFAVQAKGRRFGAACAAHGLPCAGLVANVPLLGRALVAGVAATGAVLLEERSLPAWGAGAIALAMVFAAHRTPHTRLAPRGSGQWFALAPDEAFAVRPESDVLDGATGAGRVFFLLWVAAAVGLGLLLRPLDLAWAWLVPLDALAFLAISFTGSLAQLPPDRATAPGRRLLLLHRALKKDQTLRVAPYARVPVGGTVPDELRLLVRPRASMEGVVGIEVGVAWIATPSGYASETEILVRVREASSAAARIAALAPGRPVVPGRKTDERVLRLVPTFGSRAGAVSLVKRLAKELRDRRKTLAAASWRGLERRTPANERAKSVVERTPMFEANLAIGAACAQG